MKCLVAAVALAAIAVGVFLIWYHSEPTTDLVDAHGRELVQEDIVAEEEGLFGGELFAEVRALIDERDFESAKQGLLTILESSDRGGEACILLSDVTRELNQVEEAVDYGLKAVTLMPECAEAHLSYAKDLGSLAAKKAKGFSGMLGAMKQAKLFAEEAERVIELDPSDTEARGMLLMYHMAPFVGSRERARELCAELEEIDPILGKRMRAFITYRDGDLESALEICREGIAKYPEEGGFHNTLGDILAGEKRFAEADAAYEAAREGEQDEDYWRSLYFQARMHIEHEVDPETAIALLEEYVAAEPVGGMLPKPASGYYRLGLALKQAGRVEEAQAALEECLRRDPLADRAREALADLEE